MTTVRRVHSLPTYRMLDTPKERSILGKEIARFLPFVEVTLTGGNEIAQGKITHWFPQRNFFAVKFHKKSKQFDRLTESETGLRAFFKINLLTTQLVFKTTTVRRFDENVFHYRIPDEIYKQQRRGALRVPVRNCTLDTPAGELRVIDLSTGGARLAMPTALTPSAKDKISELIWVGASLSPITLTLTSKHSIQGRALQARVTSMTEQSFGVRFIGLGDADKVLIKQYLVDQLKLLFERIRASNRGFT